MLSKRTLVLLLTTAGYGVFVVVASIATICRLNATGCYSAITAPFPLLVIPEFVLIVGLFASFSFDQSRTSDEGLRQTA